MMPEHLPGPKIAPVATSVAATLSTLLHRYRFWLAALGVIGIFALSSIPFYHPPSFWGWDKHFHVLEFFLVGLVVVNLMTTGFRRTSLARYSGAWAILVLMSLLNEVYQEWIPGRTGDWRDMVASTLGGTLAVVGVVLVLHLTPLLSRMATRRTTRQENAPPGA